MHMVAGGFDECYRTCRHCRDDSHLGHHSGCDIHVERAMTGRQMLFWDLVLGILFCVLMYVGMRAIGMFVTFKVSTLTIVPASAGVMFTLTMMFLQGANSWRHR